MTETEFRDELCGILQTNLPKYQVETGKSILYKMIIDVNGDVQPANYANPKRGQLAFQTDVLLSNEKVPLVVIETKFKGFSTHDVLTYSTKAVKHKEVYPHLRYGLIIGDADKIDRKFFVHNVGFDFSIAVTTKDQMRDIVETIRKQIRSAELMLDVLRNKKIRKFETEIQIEWVTASRSQKETMV